MRHCCPELDPIVCDPIQVVNDFYHPQVQPIIHPVEVINQHHCVPVPHHMYPVVVKEQGPVYVSSRRSKKAGKNKGKARTSSRKR